MKFFNFGFVFVLFVAIALLLMNGGIPQKYLKDIDRNEGAHREVKNDRTTALNDWQSFVDQSEQTIAANEKRIAAFKETIEEAGPKALVQYGTAVDELEQQNSDLKRILRVYSEQRLIDREHFQSIFRQRLDSVGRSIQKVFKDNV
ncbi:MAG: hypothetical protein WCW35_01895 [Bacteroidota bacterium]